jgi:hypothetical protein
MQAAAEDDLQGGVGLRKRSMKTACAPHSAQVCVEFRKCMNYMRYFLFSKFLPSKIPSKR